MDAPGVVSYFQTAPLAEAGAILAVCQAEVEKRKAAPITEPAPAAKPERRKRGPNKPRTATAPNGQGTLTGAEIGGS